eukprot:gb/GECH01001041.1/.p1 GENE.gb/GECH01001041.1/~~gb/GECH01001041.1/.p1  ORF type:complete len:469 (+),score=95.52 gb/GECH01001041.1/:1-1407(+)
MKKEKENDELMSSGNNNTTTQTFSRTHSRTVKPLHDRFMIHDKSFQQQFSHLYFIRLREMRDDIIKAVNSKWKEEIDQGVPVVDKVLSLEMGQKCIVVAILYKEMENKPNILEEYTSERLVTLKSQPENFASENDTLIVEDESGRASIATESTGIDPSQVVTGVIGAFLGIENNRGEFVVSDSCYAGLPPQPSPLPPDGPQRSDEYVVLLSGLNIGGPDHNPLQVDLLVDNIIGLAGNEEDEEFASHIARVIIAGNSVSPAKGHQRAIDVRGQSIAPREQEPLVEPMRLFDTFLKQLSRHVHVDVMPGKLDPSNYTLPQQPFARCLVPKSTEYSTMHLTTNPYELQIDSIRLLGHSGQPVEDIIRHSKIDGSLETAELCMEWRHLAPTAPDTLDSYPFYKSDPFIVKELPHVYFVGNQDSFGTKCIEKDGKIVRCISIPSFSSTGSAVLVNLRNLDCTVLQVDVDNHI